MAGAEKPKNTVFRLKLLVDNKKNKVVLAEAEKDFVDVLFSFLTLPMGTIVRLTEKNQKNQVSEITKIGCFNNIYKSVLDIGANTFMTKACKDMLLYPRSVKDNQRSWLKLNIDDNETLKYYSCPKDDYHGSYSNFCSSKCFCGEQLTKEFKSTGSVAHEEIFVSQRHLFTITDDLKVGFTSITHTLKTLKSSGYCDVDQLHEIQLDVDHDKVLALLQCLFSSETPFTDTFLSEKRSYVIPNVLNMPNLEVTANVAQPNEVMSLRVFTRKIDNKVLYIESEKDFVHLLFTFLVLPLNSAWKLAGSHLFLGCIDNLCESFNSLSTIEVKNALNNKCMLPCYYRCEQPMLDICYADYWDIAKIVNTWPITLKPLDPTCDNFPKAGICNGFLKRGTTFMVSDDLTITPMGLSTVFCSLKKWNVDLDDIEEQVINITKAEATELLRASFVTTNALNTVFQSLLLKKPKQEKV